MNDETNLTERLRDRIVSALHVGRVKPGDRLLGVREVSRETGANPRTVAKAYRVLEQEGLVEVRGRSGVYAARQDHWGGRLLAETGRWLGGILFEAWKRHIPIPELAELIRGCTVGVHLRAVVLDGTADQRRAIGAELEEAFGFTCTEIPLSTLPDDSADGIDTRKLPKDVRKAHLLVTTPFHSGDVRRMADALGKPFVVVTLHPNLVSAVELHLASTQLTVVCADPAFGDHIRSLLPQEARERIQIVLADDPDAVARLDPREPCTRPRPHVMPSTFISVVAIINSSARVQIVRLRGADAGEASRASTGHPYHEPESYAA